MPVEVMLESLPVWDIDRHRHPATHTRNLLYEKVDEYVNHLRFSRDASNEVTRSRDRGSEPAPARPDTPDEDRHQGDLDDVDIEALVENVVAQASLDVDAAGAASRAAEHELDDTRHRVAPDHPATDLRENHSGDDAAPIDARAAATERATAAERRGARTAPATRAEVIYTPPDSSYEASTPPARLAGRSPARPVPSRVLKRHQSPQRRR
jgi:hypothetical protein